MVAFVPSGENISFGIAPLPARRDPLAGTGPQLATLLDVSAGGRMRVLDIAAGHGLYCIAVAMHNPQAEVVALDWPSVLAVAREHAAAAGVADRYRTIPGSVFTEEIRWP